jgi:hypothetical protein
MIEPLLAFIVTLIALGWIVWCLRHHRPGSRSRLLTVIILMVFTAFAVGLYLLDDYGSRIQLWFGPLAAIMMAVAAYVETVKKWS